MRQVDAFERELLDALPRLRAFVNKLVGIAKMDDVVQQTLCQALRYKDGFQIGSSMTAWLFTIAKNGVRSEHRRSWRSVQWDDDFARVLTTGPDALHKLELRETLEDMDYLPPEQAEAILMIADGLSYEEAAEEAGVTPGTIKSRVSRGREALEKLSHV